MKKRVYLVGLIGSNPQTYQWRRTVTKLLEDKFEVDDPTLSLFDKELMKKAEGDTDKMHKLVEAHQAEILLPKSFLSVQKADILLVNFQIYSDSRPIIGSIMELAWAYNQHKTVIGVRGTSYYSKHPMIRGIVHAWANTLDEAVEIINEFFTSKR
jgi:hypothetical protein